MPFTPHASTAATACPLSTTLQQQCNTVSTLQNAENEMAIIAAYYGLPALSVRAAVFHQMLKNQHGYRVRGLASFCVLMSLCVASALCLCVVVMYAEC